MQMTPAVVSGHTVTIALSNLLNQLVTKSVLNSGTRIARPGTKEKQSWRSGAACVSDAGNLVKA